MGFNGRAWPRMERRHEATPGSSVQVRIQDRSSVALKREQLARVRAKVRREHKIKAASQVLEAERAQLVVGRRGDGRARYSDSQSC